MSFSDSSAAARGVNWPWLAPILLLILTGGVYLFDLDEVGMLGPDEPRYGAIGREMADSGDWVTPRLWGEGWFEKPALTYWLIGLGHVLGGTGSYAPRAPIVVISIAFLGFFYWALRRLEDQDTALAAVMMLATSAGWLAYSQVAVTDLPLAASFTASLLCSLLWMDTNDRKPLVGAGIFLGLAILAKGLVPLVLYLPLLWFARKQWRALVPTLGLAALVALPWYAAVTWVNGYAFIDEFFVRHHLSRFATEELQHTQPFWFYVPVLAGGIFPWILVATLVSRSVLESAVRRTLAATVAFGFVFFSLSANKLPGYLLPLFPAVFALIAVSLMRSSAGRNRVVATALALSLAPVIASVLPDALLVGLRRARLGELPWQYVLACVPLAALVWWLDSRGWRVAAVFVVTAGSLAGIVYTKLSAFPVLDKVVSARGLYESVKRHPGQVCVAEGLHRSWRYGLNYYTVTPLPDCAETPLPVEVRQEPGGLPRLTPAMKREATPSGTSAPLRPEPGFPSR